MKINRKTKTALAKIDPNILWQDKALIRNDTVIEIRIEGKSNGLSVLTLAVKKK